MSATHIGESVVTLDLCVPRQYVVAIWPLWLIDAAMSASDAPRARCGGYLRLLPVTLLQNAHPLSCLFFIPLLQELKKSIISLLLRHQEALVVKFKIQNSKKMRNSRSHAKS